MTLLEQIEKQLNALPPEKQNEVLDFIAFLQQRARISPKRHPLKKHTAFGSWKNRKVDAIKYQQDLRAEWKM
jgi:mRNA-degrading endonuclease RelE of RelBE toxin-antitoxin system